MLWVALENMEGGPVVEMGSGEGSTPLINQYCQTYGNRFYSFESNPDWFAKMSNRDLPLFFVKDWQTFDIGFHIGLLFVDHSPGERRKYDIEKYANRADIILAHDTEMAADYGYKMSGILSKFKYRFDFRPDGFAHTTAVSNFIDVSQWKI